MPGRRIWAFVLAVLLLASIINAEEMCSAAPPPALKACEAQLEKLKSQMETMVPQADLESSEAAANQAKAKLAVAESDLKAANDKITQLHGSTTAAQDALRKAQAKVESLEKTISHTKASKLTAAAEVEKLRARAADAEFQLRELQAAHTQEWLPHFAEERFVQWRAKAGAGIAAAQTWIDSVGGDVATAWRTQAWPTILRWVEVVKTHAAAAAATASKTLKDRGIELPDSMSSVIDTVKKAGQDMASSKAVGQAVAAAKAGAAAAQGYATTVVAELESLLVVVAKRNEVLAPLAERPLSRVFVYVFLLAPFVAVLMPLLASRRRGASATTSSPGSKKSSKGKASKTPGKKGKVAARER